MFVHLAHCLCCLKNEVVYESGMLRMSEVPTPEVEPSEEGSVASTADDASVADPRTGGISADRCPGHNPLILPRVLDIGLLVSLMRTYRKFSSLAEGIPTSGSYIYR